MDNTRIYVKRNDANHHGRPPYLNNEERIMYEHVMVRWLEAIAHNTERLAKAIEDITEAAETQLTPADVQQIIKHERLHEEAKKPDKAWTDDFADCMKYTEYLLGENDGT